MATSCGTGSVFTTTPVQVIPGALRGYYINDRDDDDGCGSHALSCVSDDEPWWLTPTARKAPPPPSTNHATTTTSHKYLHSYFGPGALRRYCII